MSMTKVWTKDQKLIVGIVGGIGLFAVALVALLGTTPTQSPQQSPAPIEQTKVYQPLTPGSDAEMKAVQREVYDQTGCEPSPRNMRFTGSDKTGSVWTVGCGDWLYLPTIYPQGQIKVLPP
jgi:hypothetical protein